MTPGLSSHFRSIWISDIHLGTRDSRTEALAGFLDAHRCENLFLVGDIIDGWSLRRRKFWPAAHTAILSRLLQLNNQGTSVTYLIGNHDEFLLGLDGLDLGRITIRRRVVHRTADGKQLLVLHGDEFDRAVSESRWLAHLGDAAYGVGRRMNGWVNGMRRRLGYPELDIAHRMRERFKSALSYVEKYEAAVIESASAAGFDGVVCGHIHRACLRQEGSFVYANTGDWVEQCTALAEHEDGELQLLRWSRAARARSGKLMKEGVAA